MKKLIVFISLIFLMSSAWAIKFPTCNIICKEGQACGNSCIPKNEICQLPVDWGYACDYRYIRVDNANKAKCCKGRQGTAGCAGDRLICYDGTLSDVCGCLFSLQRQKES